MNRRGFFQMLAGAVVAPLIPKLDVTAPFTYMGTPIVFDEVIEPGPIYYTNGELAEIIRRAFVPKMVEAIFDGSPLLRRLLEQRRT